MIGEEIEAVHWIQTQDLNPYGFAFGGMIMSKFDEIATLLAVRVTRRNCVTARVAGISFLASVQLGDMMRLKAIVKNIGRTSIRIEVSIYKLGRSDTEEILVSPPTEVVMVAMDDSFKPTPIVMEV